MAEDTWRIEEDRPACAMLEDALEQIADGMVRQGRPDLRFLIQIGREGIRQWMLVLDERSKVFRTKAEREGWSCDES